jgi:malate/lactate dehydrogenase
MSLKRRVVHEEKDKDQEIEKRCSESGLVVLPAGKQPRSENSRQSALKKGALHVAEFGQAERHLRLLKKVALIEI